MAGTAAGLIRNQLLRPEFTGQLAERLAEGACIKLVSAHGQGRRRTLSDLSLCLPGSMTVLQANLRDYPQSLASMLADLASQIGLDGIDSLEDMLDRLAQRSERTLIILHNLDELRPGTASGYDDGFFTSLNGVRSRSALSLLCVCEHAHADWPLDIETLFLPPLTPDQALAEMTRRDPPVGPGERPAIARWIVAQPAPYALLEQPEAWPRPARGAISP